MTVVFWEYFIVALQKLSVLPHCENCFDFLGPSVQNIHNNNWHYLSRKELLVMTTHFIQLILWWRQTVDTAAKS